MGGFAGAIAMLLGSPEGRKAARWGLLIVILLAVVAAAVAFVRERDDRIRKEAVRDAIQETEEAIDALGQNAERGRRLDRRCRAAGKLPDFERWGCR